MLLSVCRYPHHIAYSALIFTCPTSSFPKKQIKQNIHNIFYKNEYHRRLLSPKRAAVSTLRYFKRKGVSIIVITSLGDNDLRKYGDVVLNISTREKLYSKIGGFVNENSIKLILDILYACYFELNYDDNLNKRINISKESETTRFSSLDIMKESES